MSERIAAAALAALLFLAVIAFGASDVATATVFAGLHALYLAVLLATCDWARRDLREAGGLPVLAGLFALLVLAVLWPLTPWGPGGAHPVWSYLPGRAGSLAIDRSALLLNVLQLLGLACLFVAGRIIGASKTRGEWFLRLMLIALAAYAACALVGHVGVRRATRLTATLLSPNSAATVFGAGLLLATAVTISCFRRRPGWEILRRGDPEAMAWLGLVALLATVLMMTASRAGLISTLFGLSLFLVWNVFIQRQSLRGGAAVIGLAAVLLVAAVALRGAEHVAGRFSIAGRDLEVRSIIFGPHWAAFLSSPWSGFGLGSFPTVNQLVVTGPSLSILYDIRAAHNLYLQWLEEGGVVGAVAMLALFAAVIWPIVRGGFADSTAGLWARAATCAAIVFLVHGLTDFALQVPAIQGLCAAILGVCGSLCLIRSGRRPTSPKRGIDLAEGLTAGFAGLTILGGVLAGAPLIAGKLGADLSAWPTAPAEVLADTIETGLRGRPSSQALARLRRLSDRELALRPASGAAWLRRAAIEADLGDVTASNLALERSFTVAPLQSSLFDQRTVFAYEHWGRLSQNAREQTVYHLKAEWRRAAQPSRFVAMANRLHDPAGRVGMALQIALLRMTPPAN